MTDHTITIAQRFCGPPGSANGGYICGRMAAFVDGPACVRLMSPPPLETAMQVRTEAGVATLMLGNDRIATAKPATLNLDIPRPPALDRARSATGGYRGFHDNPYPACFVCGPDRAAHDGLRLFPGPVDADDIVAANWIPDGSLAGPGQIVAGEFVWAALDCPGAFSFAPPATGLILLGELTAEIFGQLTAGREYIVIGWEIQHEGRRHKTGTAIFDQGEACLAAACGTWFEVP